MITIYHHFGYRCWIISLKLIYSHTVFHHKHCLSQHLTKIGAFRWSQLVLLAIFKNFKLKYLQIISFVPRFFQKIFDVICDVWWVKSWWISEDWHAPSVDKKLFKIPTNIARFDRVVMKTVNWCEVIFYRWTLGLQICVEWMFIFSIDFHFLQHGKVWFKSISWSHIFQAVQDFCSISSLFLQTKLVARHADNFQIGELALKCIHWVIMVGDSSHWCHIDKEYHFTRELIQGHILGIMDVS